MKALNKAMKWAHTIGQLGKIKKSAKKNNS